MLPIPAAAYVALATPMVIDGVAQLVTKYESTNRRRLTTGVLFGVSYGAGAALAFGLLVKVLRGS